MAVYRFLYPQYQSLQQKFYINVKMTTLKAIDWHIFRTQSLGEGHVSHIRTRLIRTAVSILFFKNSFLLYFLDGLLGQPPL